jgi:hypothetical protein
MNALSSRFPLRLTLTALALLLPTRVLLADAIYTTEAAFNAATAHPTTINFSTCAGCFIPYTTYTDSGTGTAFSIATAKMLLTSADYYGAGTYPKDFLIETNGAEAVANVLTVTPPASFSAIGLDLGSYDGGTFVATLSDGTAFTITPPEFDNLSFFGFTSTSPITSFTLSIPAGSSFVLDQVVLAGNVPEPTPGAMVGIALAVAGLFGGLKKWRSNLYIKC